MKKILIFGLLVGAMLISGCVSTTPTTPTPTVTETSAATMTETATTTATPTATMTETAVATATPATTVPSTNMASVNISNFNFVPQTVAVTNGTTVTWTNGDTVAHTVTSVTGVFDSGPISPGATWSYTFNQTGSFEYSCTIHPSIPHGTVTVT